TKHGFLVREGDALERLASVSAVAFDKTGTLTYGTPTVTAVVLVSGAQSEQDLFGLCAAAERLSEHPLGKAVVRDYRKRYSDNLLKADDFSMIPGRGVQAKVQGRSVFAGNLALLEEHDITRPAELAGQAEVYLAQGCTLIYIALDHHYAGFLALSDTLRSESAAMIRSLSQIGVRPVLLTGDHPNAAGTIAQKLGLSEFHAECLPEDKLTWIESRQKQNEAVCMIGDGINDAPALKKATVGIAMGGVGSDIAVDSADIALVDDEVKELPHLFALSQRMMTTIKLNITFSMTLNFVAIGLAITGILDPVLGALVHNAGSVVVIINSALLLKWRKNDDY
ncbi:MAG: HAD-IC family P-type ATPase, partial [Oscillospiraceae bacterium]|nr:HAD-IC family P-type ATPase [Oscillospiraceae bacterium]